MIIMEDVTKTYTSGVPALNGINLHVQKGEFVFIVGKSGSGKSTLIKLLLKELDPTSGKIYVNKKYLNKLTRKKLPYLRRDIGVVFQDFRLLPDRNIYDNIAFAQKVVEAPNKKIKSRVLAMLSMVGLLDKYKSFPNELSGGEQQRVAIARALVNKPAILLCDEPTGNLDPANSNEIMKILDQVNKQGTTVLVVTHNMEIVQQMKKRTITMSEGKIISDLEKVVISMKIRSLFYHIKDGLKNIYRNRLFSLASIATITACIFLFGVFYALVSNFQYMIHKAENEVCVTVFFDEGLTDADIKKLGDTISQRNEVSRIHYTSADEAWENYKAEYFKDYPELAEGFKDDNPLANSSSYEIYLNEASSQATLVTYLENLDGIRQVNRSEATASGLASAARLVSYITIAIIVILLAVSIFLITNTIVIGITVRKEEISIMKYIGATDAFVNAPFS